MRHQRRQYVRRTPKIYGNLQPRKRQFQIPPVGKFIRQSLPYVAALFAVYILVASPLFKVRQVEIRGAALLEDAEITQHVPLGGSLWVFPKDQAATALREHPAVEDVRILRGLPNGIRIEVSERQPRAIWITGDSAALLDERGRVFLTYSATSLPGEDTAIGRALVGLPKVHDVSGLEAKSGEQVASTLFLQFIGEVSRLQAELLPMHSMDHFEVAATTYDVKMITTSGMSVSLNSLGDAGVQIRNLARLARDGKLEGASSVDLRVDRWAYVR
jgi:hypothetical protein